MGKLIGLACSLPQSPSEKINFQGSELEKLLFDAEIATEFLLMQIPKGLPDASGALPQLSTKEKIRLKRRRLGIK